MLRPTRQLAWSLSLIFVLLLSLVNINVALAEDSTPPPPVTEPATEPPVESTDAATAVSTPLPEETASPTDEDSVDDSGSTETEEPSTEALSQLPEDTAVVVVDAAGHVLPLASQDAAELILETDPMWCPEGVLPGGAGCTTNFATIGDLVADMVSNTATYDEHGVIYFTATPGAWFELTTATLTGGSYGTLSAFNLTLQGGWNGLSGGSASFTGQSDFANNRLIIGGAGSPWSGNITLNDLVFGSNNNHALTINTSTGDITLDNVDVNNQIGGFSAILESSSGDITIRNGSVFDGDNFNGRGVSVTTGSGSVAISDSVFQEFRSFIFFPPITDSLTISAPSVTLNNVTVSNGDADGISISNANIVTLNNVTASNNGYELGAPDLPGNDGSGVVVDGTPGSLVYIIGGTFNNNQEYGVEIANPANTALYVWSDPICTGNDSNLPPTSSCYNVAPVSDGTAPVITPSVSGTLGSNGWYTGAVSVSWAVSDPESGIFSSTGCGTTNLTADTTGTTLTCSATNNAGVSGSNSATIKIDQTAPSVTVPADMTIEATGPGGAVVSFAASASDNFDPSPGLVCLPPSGSSFSLGTTGVTCTATDEAGNANSEGFDITVQDTTPPTISPVADVFQNTTSAVGDTVLYTSPSTTDLVDGAGTASCSPASGSFFPIGATLVTCSASDSSGNTSSTSFTVNLAYTPLGTRSGPAQSTASFPISVTGDGVIDLQCFTVVQAFNIKVTFHNLCNYQAAIDVVDADTLPSPLPEGYTLVAGVNVVVLKDGAPVNALPTGTGVQMDLPSAEGSQYAYLYWKNGSWVEISQVIQESELAQTLNSSSGGDQLYKIGSSGKILTTDLTGIFLLVQK